MGDSIMRRMLDFEFSITRIAAICDVITHVPEKAISHNLCNRVCGTTRKCGSTLTGYSIDARSMATSPPRPGAFPFTQRLSAPRACAAPPQTQKRASGGAPAPNFICPHFKQLDLGQPHRSDTLLALWRGLEAWMSVKQHASAFNASTGLR